MSDYFGSSDSFSSQPATAVVWQDKAAVKTPGAPWLILLGGILLLAAETTAKFIFPPQGDSAWLGFAGLWLLNLISFLLPIALFSIIDLKRQLNLDYPSNTKNVRHAKFAFLVLGIAISMLNVYDLASELARMLNVG